VSGGVIAIEKEHARKLIPFTRADQRNVVLTLLHGDGTGRLTRATRLPLDECKGPNGVAAGDLDSSGASGRRGELCNQRDGSGASPYP
jgi:hypothetical protein